MNTLRNFIWYSILIFLFLISLYGAYWVAKNVSYALFYEDMVQETIREMVKPEYLKQLPNIVK